MSRNPFLFIISLYMPAIFAQEKDSLQQPYRLSEIVVSPFKQEKSLKEMPASISQITGMALRNQHLTATKEISALVPNLFIPDYGSKYTSPVYIRGVGNKSGTPAVGLYVDGIPYFEKSTFDLDLYEIESVEVYRGPQGTLYGRNTMGGLINITTRSPLKYQYTDLRFDGGMYGHYQISASHYGKLSKNVGYSVSGKYLREGGCFENTYQKEKADNEQAGNVRARLEWRIAPQWSLTLSSIYDRSVQGANAYAPLDKETGVLGDIAFDGTSSYQRTLSTTGVALKYQGERFQMNYQHALQYSKDKLRQDQDFTTVNRVNSLIGQEQWMTSGELTIKNQVGQHYRAMTGAFAFYQHTDKEASTFYSKFNTYKNDVIPTTGVAVYHQSTVEHLGWEGLSLTLGLRYDHERATRDFTSSKNQEEPRVQFTKQQFNQVVPKVAIQYMFPVKGQLYASVSKGYKTGGFNTSFNEESEKSYGPERSWNYEIGAKHPFWDKRFNAEIALFLINWKNQHVQQKVDAGGFMIRNAGRSVSKGMEFSMQCNPINGLSIHLNYGYTHAKFKNYRQSDIKDYSNHYLPLVPRHTFGGSVNYARSLKRTFFDRYQVGMNFSGNGETYWHEDNKTVQPFYGVLNATASVSKKKWTLGIWAKNLTATEYIAYQFRTSSGTFAQEGKPFTIGGSLSLKL